MTVYSIIAQTVGILGASLNIGSYQCKKNKSLIFVQLIGSTCFVINYLMLGALTGCFMNTVGSLRNLIFLGGTKSRKWWVLAILCLLLVSGMVITWGGLLSLLPFLGMLSVTLAMYTDNGKIIRICQLFISSPCWLIYNFASGTIGGVICEVFIIVSTVISIIRYGFDGFEK